MFDPDKNRAEFDQLRKKLDDAGISYEFNDRVDGDYVFGYQLCSPGWSERGKDDLGHWSVVYNIGSYGSREGLLEFWNGRELIDGWLTADKALELIKEETQK